jgi:hypothetical protein
MRLFEDAIGVFGYVDGCYEVVFGVGRSREGSGDGVDFGGFSWLG